MPSSVHENFLGWYKLALQKSLRVLSVAPGVTGLLGVHMCLCFYRDYMGADLRAKKVLTTPPTVSLSIISWLNA